MSGILHGSRSNFDHIVIGAGIVGRATAYQLVKSGKQVLLLDQFFLPHTRGSSHGPTRIVRHGYDKAVYADMMPDSFKAWRELERLSGKKLLEPSDIIFIGEEDGEGVQNTKKVLKRIGQKFESICSAEISTRYPFLDFPGNHGAVYEKDGGIALAERCGAVILQLFKDNGGHVIENEKALKIVPGSAVKVITASNTYTGGSIVVTAGSWTNDLLRHTGLKLPLKPTIVNVCYWKADEKCYSLKSGFPIFIYFGETAHFYGIPVYEYSGMMKICYHSGFSYPPDQREKVAYRQDINDVAKFLSKHFKGVETSPCIIERCYYTVTPDEDFIVDRHPDYPNIVIGAGFSGHGFKMAPITGSILADLAQGRQPSYDISPLRIGRFTNTRSKL